jgi:hypothetical protein
VCMPPVLFCPGFVVSRVCRVQGLSCPGFVVSRVCLFRVCLSRVCLSRVCLSRVCLSRVCLSRVCRCIHSLSVLLISAQIISFPFIATKQKCPIHFAMAYRIHMCSVQDTNCYSIRSKKVLKKCGIRFKTLQITYANFQGNNNGQMQPSSNNLRKKT